MHTSAHASPHRWPCTWWCACGCTLSARWALNDALGLPSALKATPTRALPAWFPPPDLSPAKAWRTTDWCGRLARLVYHPLDDSLLDMPVVTSYTQSRMGRTTKDKARQD